VKDPNLSKILKLRSTGTPVLFWGPPGVGKTATIYHAGRILGVPVVPMIGTIHDPPEIKGFYVPEDGVVKSWPHEWIVELDKVGDGIVFFDEITTCSFTQQNAMLRVIHEGKVGNHPLPPKVWRVAAGNPPSMVPGGYELTPAMATRFLHVHWETGAEWRKWWVTAFPSYFDSPLPGEAQLDPIVWARARSMVAAFLTRRPDLVLDVPKEESKLSGPWPCPREWDHASRALAACGLDPKEAFEFIVGAVGEGAGTEFVKWAEDLDLPDPEDIVEGKKGFNPNDWRSDQLFAILSSCAEAVVANFTTDRFFRFAEMLELAAREGKGDTAIPPGRRVFSHVSSIGRRDLFSRLVGKIPTLAQLMKEAGML
jgi:hypothetical protein